MDIITKKCKKCGIEKSADAFPKHSTYKGKTYYRGVCNVCWINHVTEWVKDNRERKREVTRKSAKKIRNTPEGKEKERVYRKENLDKLRETVKRWRHANKDKWRAQYTRNGHKRRTAIKNSKNTLTSVEWSEIIKLQNNQCLACKRFFVDGLTPTKDHIIPVSKGGDLTKENIQALCKSCNSRKFNKTIDYRK